MNLSGGKITSKWGFELIRDGKVIDRWEATNLVTDEMCNHILDVVYSGGTQITAWYIVPFEDDHTPAAGNTYAVPGFTESTAYDEANRQAWTEAGPSAKSITNSASKASITISAAKTLYGVALLGGGTGAATKDDQAGGGVLGHIIQFSEGKAVEDDDVVKMWATITQADDGV